MSESATVKPTKSMKRLHQAFEQAGFSIRLVGGAVRDIAIGIEPKDYDFCTPATPDQMHAVAQANGFGFHPTGIDHGTVTFVINGDTFEVTTLRVDVETDGRHAQVAFVDSYELDAARRDLTFNAMSMDIITGEVFDYFGGVRDINMQTVRFVNNPAERIREDYLRILRYFRFAARYDFKLDPYTVEQITTPEALAGLSQISVERFWQEMQKLLVAPGAQSVLDTMDKTGVLSVLNLRQPKPGYLPYDGSNPIVALFRYISDVDAFLEVWKLSADEKGILRLLQSVKQHMHGTVDEILVKTLIVFGTPRHHVQAVVDLFEPSMSEYVRNLVVPPFPVSGFDLLNMGFEQGPKLGKKIETLKRLWIMSDFRLQKQELLSVVGKH